MRLNFPDYKNVELVCWRVRFALTIFQSNPNLEAGDIQPQIIDCGGTSVEPRTPCSQSQELNNYTTAIPYVSLYYEIHSTV